MAKRRLLHPAPPWQGRIAGFTFLYHGCTDADRSSIERYGVDPARGNPRSDFGLGFYVSTSLQQAKNWAWLKVQRARKRRVLQPVVLRFMLARDAIAPLDALQFVRGDYAFLEYWSLVQHCRTQGSGNPRDHARTSGTWYDIVSGPVSAFGKQRVVMPDSDQFSFHTPKAAQLLTDAINDSTVIRYRPFPVK